MKVKMEEEAADQGTSTQHFHTGFAQRALREQSRLAASCMGERPESGMGMRRDRARGC